MANCKYSFSLFNEAGEVVGINTFGMLDSDGEMVPGMNFAIPISIAKQFLNEINVTPRESEFTRQFKEAKMLFDNEKYSEALGILRTLNETNPGYPVVADLLAQASAKASSVAASVPQVPEVPEVPEEPVVPAKAEKNAMIIIYALGGAVIVLLLVIVILLLTRRKKAVPGYVAYTGQQHNAPVHSANAIHSSDTAKPLPQEQNMPPEAGKFCSECGAQLLPNSRFCINCGVKLQ